MTCDRRQIVGVASACEYQHQGHNLYSLTVVDKLIGIH